MSIIAADGFKISKTNTPTREGERIATIAEITDRAKVPNPSVGMIIFVEDEQRHYKVLELASDVIGGVTVENAVVKRYKELSGDVDLSDYYDKKTADERFGSAEEVAKLWNKVFPLVVELTTSPGTSTGNALNNTGSNVPREIVISWKLTIDGVVQDANEYEGTLKIGSTVHNLGNAEMGSGKYSASLSATTAITLTVNDVTKSTTVYFAAPMYSKVLPMGTVPTSLSDMNQITPIAVGIANMGNQAIAGLATDYVYWIAVPDNLTITGAKDVNSGFGFPLEKSDSVSMPGYKVYRSGDLAANSSWTIKIN